MAHSHISIVQTEHGVQLKAYRDALKLVITEGPLLLDKMAKMVDPTPDPDDYSHLENQFGLAGGTGLSCKGELTSVVEAMQADPAESTSQAGNAALLKTKLKQFVDTVG